MILLALLCAGSLVLVSGGCGSNAPSVPVRPWGAESTVVGAPSFYHTLSATNAALRIRYIFDWGDLSKFDTTQFFLSGDTADALKYWDHPGNYQIKALALDEYGRASREWSAERAVKVVP